MSVAEIKASSGTLDAARPVQHRKQVDPAQIIRWTLLFLGGIVMVMPIVYMLSTSFKWPHEIYNLQIIPDEPKLKNYI
ncbi:MAG: hypothetical protein ACU0C9_11675 [Paracoccaceae bacterium]